jgi:tripartite-type tricarboxylate transporter receptor subunit TctC
MSERLIGVVIALALACAASIASAESYPKRPIRLLVGFPPGGAADTLGRIAAQRLTEGLGQQVVVDNRGGAGGLIATEIAVKASPDGYTLLFTSIPHVINPHLRRVRYDAVRDFVPVVQFVSVPLMMAAHPSFPARSIKAFIAFAQGKPGEVNFASAGAGSSSHLAMELFKSMTGIRVTHVPYKGTGPMLVDLIAGRVSATIASAVPLSPHVRSGKLRGLGVTSPKRASAFPDLPAIAETVAGYEVINWFGILAPRGAPKAAVSRINAVLNEALRAPSLVKLLNSRTAETAGGTPEAFGAAIRADYAKWGKVVRASGARVD